MISLRCANLGCEKPNWMGKMSLVHDISLSFSPASFYAISGDEGCGKNLFLQLLGLLEKPATGEIYIEERAMGGVDDKERERIRNTNFGYLLEGWTLLPAFTVVENIAIPFLRHFDARPEEARSAAEEALDFCGIRKLASALVCDLPAPIQEITAFARAIAHKPKVLLAESLVSSPAMLALARASVEEFGVTVIWSGTREDLTGYSDRLIELSNGKVICDEPIERSS